MVRFRPLRAATIAVRRAHFRAPRPPLPPPVTPPDPPRPPRPPQKPVPVTAHGVTWHDPYRWMSDLENPTAMRHMNVLMEAERRYTGAVMDGSDRLQRKLLSELSGRMLADLCTPPVRWGPWLYYRRVEEGKEYPVLCRRSALLNEEFVSYSTRSTGFDYVSGRKIEQRLLDYNREAERFGGSYCEQHSEVSPDHRFLAYTMYDKDKDTFVLSVRDLIAGTLCNKPQAERVSSLAWAMNGKALLYTITNRDKRPYRIYCSIIGSNKEDTLILEEPDENVNVHIRSTKDFHFVTVNTFSDDFSKVYLINAADPLSGMKLLWECGSKAHCVVEHHRGYLYLFTDASREGSSVDSHYLLRCPVESSGSRTWENVFIDERNMCIEDVEFCDTHLALILREDQKLRICSVPLPLPVNEKMPDAVVDYDLLNGKWVIVQQQNVLHERTRTLYGTASPSAKDMENSHLKKSLDTVTEIDIVDDGMWNDLSEFYACEYFNVSSKDGVLVPLTIVYSRKMKQDSSPCLLHGDGAYGKLLDKRWRSELKSLLDRGWVVAYADVRGGGGKGKKWHHDGTREKKLNSIIDYITCAEYLIDKGVVPNNKLAGWGYDAGGLLVASAINIRPDLFRAAILKAPFLDPCNTLLSPTIPLMQVDYEEFGNPSDVEDFQAIHKYSPYDNIKEGVPYPAVLVTSHLNARFGVWEALKWAARVREKAVYDPRRPILLNLTQDTMEGNRYALCKALALELAFLIEIMSDP
ncbi:hypothetical protein QJS10_CPB17g02547 [Acorus calamus]|uniref:Prolyl endopeptidase n=1 Tax=Acorus calamus TaxID=4465 RepID=A0AAV9CVP9_ACOCL|nr:hypothetical protein QJS10_CPB17g02547 [Acorus calamus]